VHAVIGSSSRQDLVSFRYLSCACISLLASHLGGFRSPFVTLCVDTRCTRISDDMASISVAGVAFRAASHVTASAFIKALPRGAYTTARTCGGGRAVFEFTTHVERMATSARLMGLEEGAPDAAAMRRELTASIAAAVRHHWLSTGVDWGGPAATEPISHAPTSPPAPVAVAPPFRAPELKISCLLTWSPAHITAAVDAIATLSDHTSTWVDGATGVALASMEESVDRIRSAAAVAPWLLLTHVTPLPHRRAPPIVVEMHGSPRVNALAKDSEWVR